MSLFDDRGESENLFAETRMTFGEHLEELRTHLWKAIYGFLIAMVLSFFIAPSVLQLIAAPVEEQLQVFYAERVKTVTAELDAGNARLQEINEPIDLKLGLQRDELAQLGIKAPPVAEGEDPSQPVILNAKIQEPLRLATKLHKALSVVGRRPALSTLSIQEAFMAYIKVALACGLVIGSPWIFYQIWLFIAAGLYPTEKRLVHVYLPVSLGLFLFGIGICEVFVMPKAVEALLWFNQWLGLEPELRFNEWLSFAILMPLVFGISFQLPLVMMFLERIGIFSVETYISHWRIACFVIHVFAAVITPSIDPFSMEALALPMFGLYGLGIFLCRLNPRRRDTDIDVPEPGEMVEV